MARPTIYTDAVGAKIVDEIRHGAPVKFAAARAGVSLRVVYAWLAKGEADDPPEADEPFVSFALLYREAEAEYAAELLASVRVDAKGWQRHAWTLERRFPKEYGARKLLEHVGADGEPLNVGGPAAVVILPPLDDPPAPHAVDPQPGPADPLSRE